MLGSDQGGRVFLEASKEKIRKKTTGRVLLEAHKEKIRKKATGRVFLEASSKEKICKKSDGQGALGSAQGEDLQKSDFLEASKEKMHKKAMGRVFSEATKEKMRTRAKKEHYIGLESFSPSQAEIVFGY
jgi:hypothetical protein